MKTKHLGVIALLLFLLFPLYCIKTTLLKSPPVWPDEANYAEVARNILTEGRLGIDFGQENIPGMKYHAYWNPPLFFYANALWLKGFGFSLLSQRLLSVFIGVGCLIIFFLLSRTLTKNVILSLISVGALSIDYFFLLSLKVSRPDILVIFFGLLSVYFWYLNERKHKNIYLVLLGFFSGVTMLSHYIGIIIISGLLTFYIFRLRFSIFKEKTVLIIIFSFMVPISLWFLTVIPNFYYFYQQFRLEVDYHNAINSYWLINAFKDITFFKTVPFVIYTLSSLLVFTCAFSYRTNRIMLLASVLLCSWVFAVLGKILWYIVYPTPFIYLGLVLVFLEANQRDKDLNKCFKFASIFLLIFAISVNLLIGIKSLNKFSDDMYSYNQFSKSILEIVPDKKTVMLSSIPSAYYVFKDNNRDNKLLQYPLLKISREEYLSILDGTDYVIYTKIVDYIMDNLLSRYIVANQEKITKIGSRDQYQAYIVRLKPKSSRVHP